MEIKAWIVRGVCEEEGGKLEEKDFTKEFMTDEFVSLVMKRKFEQIQERAQKVEKVENKLREVGKMIEEVAKIEPPEKTV
jgi:hypothetical protein